MMSNFDKLLDDATKQQDSTVVTNAVESLLFKLKALYPTMTKMEIKALTDPPDFLIKIRLSGQRVPIVIGTSPATPTDFDKFGKRNYVRTN